MGGISLFGMPIWYLNCPGENQARMAHEVMQDYYLNGAIVYIDDTVIYGRDVEDFLDRILSQMAKFNVRL